MKKLLFLCMMSFLLSCSSDDKSTTTELEVNLTVDHYRTTSLFHGTAFVVTENGQPQEFAIPFITSFDFQSGFRYQLRAMRRTIVNDGTSQGIDTYHLISIQSQDTIPPNTTFMVPLAKFVNGFGYVKWVVGNADTGYVLNNEIPIDCQRFCGELVSKFNIEDNVTGEFEHGPNGSYILRTLF